MAAGFIFLDIFWTLKFSFQSINSRLMFQAKGSNHGGQRLQSQRYCDQISNILQHFLPGKPDRRCAPSAQFCRVRFIFFSHYCLEKFVRCFIVTTSDNLPARPIRGLSITFKWLGFFYLCDCWTSNLSLLLTAACIKNVSVKAHLYELVSQGVGRYSNKAYIL